LKKDILILGPSPFNEDINHSGGQLTASTNLIKYIENRGITYDIIDTFRSTFPPPSLKEKLVGSWFKYRELKSILKQNSYSGALVFGTHGLGYWEKLLFSLTIESIGIKTLFFIRSGHFMKSVEDKNYKVFIKTYLMNKVSYIGYQGGRWEDFYKKMGIKREKLIKILNWIEIKEYKKKTKTEKVKFLFVGWMVKEKGVNELVDVILEYRDLKKYEFIFIGGGTLLKELQQKIEKSGVNNVFFKGWLDSSIVASYYEKVDVLVLPSYAEGFPNVILEALNYRLPIIATDVGGISESVIDGYNGFLIEPKDKQKLYNSIKRIGELEVVREKFSKNSGDILKKNHSIEVNCNKIFELFKIKIKDK
jgi:glycosyltransferase involved in cell wall biosynthesis